MKRFITVCIIFLLALCGFACAKTPATGPGGVSDAPPDRSADSGSAVSAVTSETEETAETEGSGETTGEETYMQSEQIEPKVSAKLLYMGQGSVRITTPEGRVIYIDPYAGDGYGPAADLILVTHGHYDHNQVEKVANRAPGCRIITWTEALAGGKHQTFDLGFANVEAVEAGNNPNHSLNSCVGYIITLSDGVSVYLSGDTSKTGQMQSLADREIDYALFCCDGVYNMGVEEAAECARIVGAKHNIPYHTLGKDGKYFDPERAALFDAPDRLIIAEGEEIELVKE